MTNPQNLTEELAQTHNYIAALEDTILSLCDAAEIDPHALVERRIREWGGEDTAAAIAMGTLAAGPIIATRGSDIIDAAHRGVKKGVNKVRAGARLARQKVKNAFRSKPKPSGSTPKRVVGEEFGLRHSDGAYASSSTTNADGSVTKTAWHNGKKTVKRDPRPAPAKSGPDNFRFRPGRHIHPNK